MSTFMDLHAAVREHLVRIENAFYYSPGDAMAAVCPQQNTVIQRRNAVPRPLCIVAGNGNRPLAEAVALLLGVPTHQTRVTQRAGGEVNVRIDESVLGADVYIVQSTTSNELIDINTAFMELFLLMRKMRLSNAKRVTAVIPFLGYTRRDSKTGVRGSISASAIAEMLTTVGVDRITTVELHSGQIQGFYGNTPLDNLQMSQEFAQYLRSQPWFDPNNMAIVAASPDSMEQVRKLADMLHIEQIVTIMKRRSSAGADVLQAVGDVGGLICVIVDGVCSTGKTLVSTCELLKTLGATKVTACCTHGILTPQCTQRINKCDALSEIVVSDSIPQEEHQREVPKLKVITIAPLLATVITRHISDQCISSLFDIPLVFDSKSKPFTHVVGESVTKENKDAKEEKTAEK